MKKLKLGMNFTVFILFFSIALIEAFQKQNYLEALIFLALGGVSLWTDFHRN